MRHTRLPLIFAAVTVVGLALAGAQSRYQYLLDVTSKLYALNAEDGRAPTATNAAVARQACDAMVMLMKDQQFAKDLAQWEKDQFPEQRTQFKRDIGLFVDAFLVPERAILRQARLDGESQSRILLAAAAMRESVDKKIDAAQIMKDADRFRAYACGVADRLDRKVQVEESKGIIRRLALGFGGLSLIAVDMAVAVPAPLVSTTSIAVGGSMVYEALPK